METVDRLIIQSQLELVVISKFVCYLTIVERKMHSSFVKLYRCALVLLTLSSLLSTAIAAAPQKIVRLLKNGLRI